MDATVISSTINHTSIMKMENTIVFFLSFTDVHRFLTPFCACRICVCVSVCVFACVRACMFVLVCVGVCGWVYVYLWKYSVFRAQSCLWRTGQMSTSERSMTVVLTTTVTWQKKENRRSLQLMSTHLSNCNVHNNQFY